MPALRLKLPTLIGYPVLSMFTTLLVIGVSASVISELPRSVQGEAVLAPWWKCVAATVAGSFFLPWAISLFAFRDRLGRLYFLGWLVVSNLLCHVFVASALLTEA